MVVVNIILKEKILEAKQILGEKTAYIIAEDLHIDKWDSKSLKGCCPFHKEDTPSFIWNKKDNHFKCFGCGINYGILDHYQRQGLSFKEAVQKLFNETNTIVDDFEFINKSNIKDSNYFANYIYPKEETNTDRTKVEEYLAKRHISKETLDFVGIKQDVYGNIVFEHRDVDGKLLCVKYRPSRPVRKGEDKMWWQKKASTCPILYGVNQIDITKPLLIVEGHIDRLSCIEAGFTNVVSIPHGAENLSWIEFNWEWLDNFETIILWYDNDTVGQTALKNVIVRLGEHRCKIVEPDQVVIDKIKEFYKQYNVDINKADANNVLIACGKQEVLNLINNAKEVPISDVVDIMDCQDVDIQNINKIPTGFNELDKLIYGQIEGTLNIWSGYTGQGKTVVIVQSAIIESVENGHKVFVFSGELEGGQLKNWLIKPWAGEKHTIEWDNGENMPKGYTVTNEAREYIKNYYKNKIFFYDTYLNTKPEAILNRMEFLFKKYGVDVFVLDNLMCVDFSDYSDEWAAQKKFILDLLKFTVKYKTYTHLVCHPKKPDGKNANSAYDIYGSSNLGNLTHRLYWVSRNNKQEELHDSEISIIKDRPTGITNKKIKLYYNKQTMRLISSEEDRNRKYLWEQNISIKYPKHIQEKLVCNINKKEEKEVFG